MNCKSASQLLSHSKEWGIVLRSRIELAKHLAGCSECQKFNADLAFLSSLGKSFNRDSGIDNQPEEALSALNLDNLSVHKKKARSKSKKSNA
jgi:hypothetical protein